MDWLTILGPSLFSVILAALVGVAVWFLKTRVEELRAIEEKLRDQRRKIDVDILFPVAQLFSGINDEEIQAQALETLKSVNYRKASLELFVIGSDEVVKSYNELMRCAFRRASGDNSDPMEILDYWALLLIEIRKSLGNKRTHLEPDDMLRGMIKDFDELRVS